MSTTSKSSVGRRSFLKTGGAIAGVAALQAFAQKRALGLALAPVASPYGPLGPAADGSTGLTLLNLPAGFRYWSLGWTGDPMSNGDPTPGAHDGMGVVREVGPLVVLVRNHELDAGGSPGAGTPFAAPGLSYDPKAPGGCTTLVFDRIARRLTSSWPSLSGTVHNCAGGPTPWGSWMTCEETVDDASTTNGAGVNLGYQRTHGWVFEVPALGAASPTPLTGMGRFSHEALAVDPHTGIAYLTEDATPSGFYRFFDDAFFKHATHGHRHLQHGRPGFTGRGRLQMLRVRGEEHFQKDLMVQGPTPFDPAWVPAVQVGDTFKVDWVDVADPTNHVFGPGPGGGVFNQGFALGGARFARLEGCWHGRRRIFFTATSGGPAREGQVWEYNPANEKLTLVFQQPVPVTSAAPAGLDNPDNLTVTPRGGVLCCEDGGRRPQSLQGILPSGDNYLFAQNNVILAAAHNAKVPAGNYTDSEWAGATFSEDGRWLFVNLQTPGITFAITGPWENGPL